MKTNWKNLLCLTLSLLMLLGACIACAPSNEEPPKTDDTVPNGTTPGGTTPAGTTPGGTTPDSSTPSEGGTKSLAEQGTEAYVSDSYTITYVTYNGYHNPIEERVFTLYSPDSYSVNTYEYNAEGLLVGVTSVSYSNSNYRDAELNYSIQYTPVGKSYTSSEVFLFEGEEPDGMRMLSSVEYYDNGTIKSWSLFEGDEESVGFSMDESGRRTIAKNEGEQITYTYTGESRTPATVTYGEDSLVMECQLTYTDGKLSALAMKDADSNDIEVELAHTEDGKSLSKSVWRQSGAGSAQDTRRVFEMTYTDTGLLASCSFEFYQDETRKTREVTTFEYFAVLGKLSKQTTETYRGTNNTGESDRLDMVTLTYDAKGNRIKISEKAMGANGQLLLSENTQEMEYNAAGKVTKRISKTEVPGSGVTDYEVEEYEYDAKNRCIKETVKVFDRNGALDDHEERRYEYTERGAIAKYERLSFNDYGEVDSRTVHTMSYEYYDNGEMKTYTMTVIDYTHSQITDKYRTVMEFDENGEQTKQTYYYYDNPNNRDEITDTQVYY